MVQRNPIRIWIPGWLTPSLNELLGKHPLALKSHRDRAARALLCALVDLARSDSISTTSPEAQNSLSINSAIAALSRTIVQKKWRSSSAKSRFSKNASPAPWLKSFSTLETRLKK